MSDTAEKIGSFLKGQWVAINWTARCSAFLSIMGSSTILFMILRRRKVRMALVHNRIIFAMSIIDIFSSLSWAVGPLAAPADENEIIVYGARGTDTTCTLQGFFFAIGLAVPMYNGCLSLVYLCVIRYNTPDEVLMKREKFIHIFPIGVASSIAMYGIITNSFATDGSVLCWFSDQGSDSGRTIVLGFAALTTLIILGSMALIYQSVRKQSQIMNKYETFQRNKLSSQNTGRRRSSTLIVQQNLEVEADGGEGINNVAIVTNAENQNENLINQRNQQGTLSAQKETAQQAYLFIGAYFSTYIFSVVDNFLDGRFFFITIFVHILYPLQGFWNFIIFLRPKYVELKKKNRSKPFRWIIFKAIFSSVEEEEQKKTRARQRSYILRCRKSNNQASGHRTSTGGRSGTISRGRARSNNGRDISRLKAIMGEKCDTDGQLSTKNESKMVHSDYSDRELANDELVVLEDGNKFNEQENYDDDNKKLTKELKSEQLLDKSNQSLLENLDSVSSG